MKAERMDPLDEAQAIQQQLQNQFASTPSILQVESRTLHRLPFSCYDLVSAIKQLATYKAVPPGYVPTNIWKRYAQPVGERLWNLIENAWLQNPKSWAASWICLIPKPQKSQDSIRGWRPISLQDPCGKALLSAVTRLASNQCYPYSFVNRSLHIYGAGLPVMPSGVLQHMWL